MTGLAKHKLYKGTLTYTVSVQSESILTVQKKHASQDCEVLKRDESFSNVSSPLELDFEQIFLDSCPSLSLRVLRPHHCLRNTSQCSVRCDTTSRVDGPENYPCNSPLCHSAIITAIIHVQTS